MSANKFYKFLYFDNLSKVYFYNNFYLYIDNLTKESIKNSTFLVNCSLLFKRVIFFKNLCLINFFFKYFFFDFFNQRFFLNILKSRGLGVVYGNVGVKDLFKIINFFIQSRPLSFYILIYEAYLVHFGFNLKVKKYDFSFSRACSGFFRHYIFKILSLIKNSSLSHNCVPG